MHFKWSCELSAYSPRSMGGVQGVAADRVFQGFKGWGLIGKNPIIKKFEKIF